jgi:hypothetical protein
MGNILAHNIKTNTLIITRLQQIMLVDSLIRTENAFDNSVTGGEQGLRLGATRTPIARLNAFDFDSAFA